MKRDPAVPEPAFLFEPVEDRYGKRLALVFGNEAPGGRCPFYERQCFHCDIGAGEGTQFDTAMNFRRLAFFREHYAAVLPDVAHLVIYNSGSVLNPHEFRKASLQSILEWVAALPACRFVSLDSREAFVTTDGLDRVLRALRTDQQPRPILGLETQDERARLAVINKRMPRNAVEAAFETVGRYQGRVGLDINIVFGLPPFQGSAAVAEAQATARFSLALAVRYGVPVDFNFHPYYPSRMGREHFPNHQRADLSAAMKAIAYIHQCIVETGRASSLFIGWYDEAHDQQPATRRAELEQYQKLFHRFNITQQPPLL